MFLRDWGREVGEFLFVKRLGWSTRVCMGGVFQNRQVLLLEACAVSGLRSEL